MAFASPHVTTFAVEVTEYPDLARRYHVSGVPKTIVNENVEILGALPEPAFVEQALGPLTRATDADTTSVSEASDAPH